MATHIHLSSRFVEKIRRLKDEAKPVLYQLLCSLIVTMDDGNFLNDQMCVSVIEGDISIEWPQYGLFADLEEGMFRIHHQGTKTSARLANFGGFTTLLISLLEQLVDVKDVRRKKKIFADEIECTIPF